jgi:hypothetical protein
MTGLPAVPLQAGVDPLTIGALIVAAIVFVIALRIAVAIAIRLAIVLVVVLAILFVLSEFGVAVPIFGLVGALALA